MTPFVMASPANSPQEGFEVSTVKRLNGKGVGGGVSEWRNTVDD